MSPDGYSTQNDAAFPYSVTLVTLGREDIYMNDKWREGRIFGGDGKLTALYT